MQPPHRGFILPTVLFVLLLLGLLGAMFSFRVNADLASTQAAVFKLQTRLAAEAGVAYVKLMLRTSQYDMDRWYNNPDELHRILVWAKDTDPMAWGTDEELEEGALAYRFSIVADDPTDDLDYIRFGITDQSSKLNLNVATEAQLLILVTAAVGDDEEVNPRHIVDAILDWRDTDGQATGEAGDTEGAYYKTLDSPYLVKNGPFETVEELLLVKGVTGHILYGEDFDRNGLLTRNENDGDESFPPDNEDEMLNRGLYPYLTVASYEDNVDNDNRPRIYLFGDQNTLREQLTEVFEGDPEAVDYIVTATSGQGGPGKGDSDSTGKEGTKGVSGSDSTGTQGSDKIGGRQQVQDPALRSDDGDSEADASDSGQAGGEDAEESDGAEPSDNEGETDDAQSASGPIRTPASLLLPRSIRGEIRPSPLDLQHLVVLMDRTTVLPPDQPRMEGLINVNTAPPPVLRCIEGLTEEQVGAIADVRGSLSAEEKATTAWLIVEEVVDLPTFEKIAPSITARGKQFSIEALGYADHIGMVSRVQVVVDMIGPIAQTIYYRDLTHLGGHYPIRQEDEDNIRIR